MGPTQIIPHEPILSEPGFMVSSKPAMATSFAICLRVLASVDQAMVRHVPHGTNFEQVSLLEKRGTSHPSHNGEAVKDLL